MKLLLRLLKKMLKFILCGVTFVFLLFSILWVAARYRDYQICVELPNGLIISRISMINTRKFLVYFFEPEKFILIPRVTLKLPGGKALIRDIAYSFYFTKTTAYGAVTPSRHTKDDYSFAYRPDVGFILYADDPKTYKKLKAEAGPPIPAARGRYGKLPALGDKDRYVHTGLYMTYLELIKDPAYRRENCNPLIFR